MTPKLLRDINSRAVLNLLRVHNPCSCADLARYSGLSAPTVASSVAHLERLQLVRRLGPGHSSGGRPPALLGFNPRCGYAAAVEITAIAIRVRIVDLDGATAGEMDAPIEKSWPAAVVELAAGCITALRQTLRIPVTRMLAIGVSAPGITDVDAGVVTFVPGMTAWENVPLGRLFHEKTRIRTIIENDVNLAALAEHWHGIAQAEKNFVFVSIGKGVGAGVFINGSLHHGPEWTAGEIGYLPAPDAGLGPVRKSQPGSLENAIGSDGIEAKWSRLSQKRSRKRLPAAHILSLADAGDAAAIRIVAGIAETFAAVCTSLSLILNCSLVVLGGELGIHESLLKATTSLLERNEFARPRLAVSQLGRDASLLGAARLALGAVRLGPLNADPERHLSSADVGLTR